MRFGLDKTTAEMRRFLALRARVGGTLLLHVFTLPHEPYVEVTARAMIDVLGLWHSDQPCPLQVHRHEGAYYLEPRGYRNPNFPRRR